MGVPLANRVRSGRKQPQRIRRGSSFSLPPIRPEPMPYPATIIHGDWSKEPRKRVAALARHRGGGRYVLPAVARFDRLATRPSALLAFDRPVLAGFDFPIGVPARYGRKLGLADFKALLAALDDDPRFASWGDPADVPGEISQGRPFYPARPGGARREHLLAGHGAGGIVELLRRCERRTADRPAACCLFWTLGGNQVGRAAVAGWAEIVRPLVATGDAGLWPFDGPLSACLRRFPVTIAESYPADAMRQIGLKPPRRWSKRRQSDRAGLAGQLLGRTAALDIAASTAVQHLVGDGFGADSLGEDRFDAFVGLLGMIAVARCERPEGAPQDACITDWEGWIFGQATIAGGHDGRPL